MPRLTAERAPRAEVDPRAAARAAQRAHDENFPVAFLLAPRDVRDDLRAVYAFCRATDDLGDEGERSPAERLRALDDWEMELHLAFGGEPRDPRLRALAVAASRRRLDPEPFLRLIEANRMDQRQDRWATYEDLLEYCRHSATPVGRMVLDVLGHRDPWRRGMSDATCIGLQLINFWQDVRRDLDDRGRIYLPQEDMARFGVSEVDLHRPAATPAVRELIAFEVGRTREWFALGAPLHRFVGPRYRLDLRMFTAGGLALCDAIARGGHDTLARRPAPGRLGRARIAAGALARLVRPAPGGLEGDGVTAEQAYAVCREIARHEARNFYYGFVLLPPERRAGIYAAYAFSRRCDDSVDGTEVLPDKLRAIAERRLELDACYAGAQPTDDAVLVALSDAVRRFAIPRRHFDDLLDGVEMDLEVRRYPDFPELKRYCDRVAGAVGLVSLHVFGFRDRSAPAHAEDLGVALQIVNIMRDVAEDAARDRIYLPQDEMAAHGVGEAEILAGVPTPGFRALMRDQAARASAFFARGERLLPLLDRRARMCVGMLAGTYREILAEIEARDYDVFRGRVALSRSRKLALMGQRTVASLAPR